MSATGRGAVRRDADFYATPAGATRSILRYLEKTSLSLTTNVLVDPCAGEGAVLDVARESWPEMDRYGLELSHERVLEAVAERGHLVVCRDALADDPWTHVRPSPGEVTKKLKTPSIVLTNPPYSLAIEFVQRALKEVADGGIVAMLLRLNWLEGQKRAEWMRANTPTVCVLPKRPSFTGAGTDATGYAWMIWADVREGRARATPTVSILEIVA